MRGFSPITLTWKGQDYVVPAKGQLLLVAQVEDALIGRGGGQAVDVLLRPGGPPFTRLAAAYGAALRYAGAKVSDEEVYLEMHEGIARQDVNAMAAIQAAVMEMIMLISPPIGFQMGYGDREEEANGEEGDASGESCPAGAE
ncbi:hypothetical protein [Pseudooceanicola marinus]|uniref:hypothetical protein n=1 Tax=Pseudooceanicola marinus TaxID=396013 RepID=UPI001CD5C482|nr:hypothetical protein [Pseudooceanicola marinus]MCA1337356.1 hypothetical protein [Pseudooceanicola marinus]